MAQSILQRYKSSSLLLNGGLFYFNFFLTCYNKHDIIMLN